MARVDNDGQVAQRPNHRNRRHVKQVASQRVKPLDAPFAEYDVGVSLGEDVFGAHQKVVNCGTHATLQQHRRGSAADFTEENEILHVPCADLEHVGMLQHLVQVAWVGDLGDNRKMVAMASMEPLLSLSATCWSGRLSVLLSRCCSWA